jgi:hypothetical protein
VQGVLPCLDVEVGDSPHGFGDETYNLTLPPGGLRQHGVIPEDVLSAKRGDGAWIMLIPGVLEVLAELQKELGVDLGLSGCRVHFWLQGKVSVHSR